VAESPERIGYPGGQLPDESNYLKLLLVPLKLYGPVSWLTQALPMQKGLERQPSPK